ncbi:MAG: WD40 repeat domain-containing protein, partial [archaeon]
MRLHINRYKLLSFILMILVVITLAGCDDGELGLTDDAEFDVLIEVIDTDEEGLEDVSLELEDIDGNTQTAEATGEKGIYEFLNVKLEKDSEFTVNIDKDGYQSENVDLIADSDTINATGSEAITLEEEEKEPVEFWSFEGHNDNVEAVAVDAEGYVYSASGDSTVRKI